MAAAADRVGARGVSHLRHTEFAAAALPLPGRAAVGLGRWEMWMDAAQAKPCATPGPVLTPDALHARRRVAAAGHSVGERVELREFALLSRPRGRRGFSSTRSTRFVPPDRDDVVAARSTLARATWPASRRGAARPPRLSTTARLASRFLRSKAREADARASFSSRSRASGFLPVRESAASGEWPRSRSRARDGREDLLLDRAAPTAVLALERRDLCTSTALRIVCARLGEPEVADLARLDQLGHRADGLLDRDLRGDAVLVVRSIGSTPRRSSDASHAERT